MIKSNNLIIQIYAVLSGIVLTYYGFQKMDYSMILCGSIIIFRDTYLVFMRQECEKADNIEWNLEIRSGNKLIQMLAMIYGLYIIIFYRDIVLLLIGSLMLFGDGYLFLFEESKRCVTRR